MMVRFFLAILSIVFLGFTAFIAISKRSMYRLSFPESLAISFGLGCAVVALEMFFLSVLGIKLNIFSIIIFQIPAYAWGIRALFKHEEFIAVKFPKPSFSPVEIIFICVIAYNVFSMLLVAHSTPFLVWDSWSQWGYKAKLLYLHGGIDPRMLKPVAEGGCYAPHYPLLLPLLESYIWFFLGAINEQYAKLVGPLYLSAMLIIFYSALKKTCPRTIALGFTLVLTTTPLVSQGTWGYADSLLTFYFTCATLFGWRYIKEKEPLFLFLGCIFLGMAMWVKNEGMTMWVAFVVSFYLLIVTKQLTIPFNRAVFFIVIPLAVFLPWVLFKMGHGVGILEYWRYKTPNYEQYFTWEQGRLPLVLNFFASQFIMVQRWNLLWILFGMTVFFRIKPENRFLLCVLTLQMFFIISAHFFTPTKLSDLQAVMTGSASRVLTHFVPLVLFFVSQQLWDRFGENTEKGQKA